MNFAVLWLYSKVFSAKFGARRPLARQKQAIRESFLSENRLFHQFVKIFSLESLPLYGITSLYYVIHRWLSLLIVLFVCLFVCVFVYQQIYHKMQEGQGKDSNTSLDLTQEEAEDEDSQGNSENDTGHA